MYRYARATRTLRAAAALLALPADELVGPRIKPPEALSFLPNPPTGAAFLFDALAVRLGGGAHLCACQASCRRLRLGGGAHLCACQAFVSPRRRLPLASAFVVCEQCGVIKVRVAWTRAWARGDGLRSRREVVTVCLRECLGLSLSSYNSCTCDAKYSLMLTYTYSCGQQYELDLLA